LGNLATPKSVQKLQTALHAKAKAEAGYRFYALYDKISRDDILAHAYAQCRSNKGAPGIDGQDFADIEAYGVERWLAELALALRQETYRPEPIRRVFIPKANGQLRPLGISSVRDRVCTTAALLVLEPIFEADLPPEIYAYRAGRNAQQAVVEVEELLFRGHPEVVDADLADYFGSLPHADLVKSVARRIVDRRVLHLIKMWLECPWKKPTTGAGPDAQPRPGIAGAASRKAHRSHHCWPICTCAGLCWGGRSSASSKASALASSLMRTIL
jgi:RNA-directed DNA polymerase